MSTHVKTAGELFQKGYNCAQAVFGAFCDETGIDFETAVKIAFSFGGGIGGMGDVCGAVSGMLMVLGVKYGYINPADKEAKSEHYRLVRDLVKRFETENGSIVCRELLERLKEKKCIPAARPCAVLVENAAKILDEYI
ncbi:MAG: C_GCAxxG_C_C family protein [Clostridiales bacterium]|nr:C_GCAxxG_C_C family protein [Clostridiales bacterium]